MSSYAFLFPAYAANTLKSDIELIRIEFWVDKEDYFSTYPKATMHLTVIFTNKGGKPEVEQGVSSFILAFHPKLIVELITVVLSHLR